MAKEEVKKVYCQYCGTDLTDIGGDISDKGKIYCPEPRDGFPILCLELSVFNDPSQGMLIGNYFGPKEVQREIKKGKLVHFTLEESVKKLS